MEQLVEGLVRSNAVRSSTVRRVLLNLDRRHFVAADYASYEDHPLPIGCGQTISAPHVHALALEVCRDRLLHVGHTGRKGVRILDVGSGSGYLSGAFALLLQEMKIDGRVVGIEKYQQLVDRSLVSLQAAGLSELLRTGMLTIEAANAYRYESDENFDFIHAGAAAESIPMNLVSVLAEDGQLLVPIGPHGGIQEMTLVTKHAKGKLELQELMTVRYVPLVAT